MAKKVREQNKWTIPSDWSEENDGYMCYLICVPNSRQWRGIFDGQISDLAYGRNWNKLTGSIKDNQEIARGIFESMCAQKCDDIIIQLTNISASIQVLVEQGTTRGQAVGSTPDDGVISVGPGEQFPDQEAYFDAKCNVANGIYDTVKGVVTWLDNNSVDLLAGGFGSITAGLFVGFAFAGPAGWALGVAGGLVATIASFLLSFSLDFADMLTAITDTHSLAVKALWAAADPETAESEFVAAVETSATPLTVVETQFIKLLLSNDMLNQLFSPRADMAEYQSPSPIDCASGATTWTFPTDAEGWTFRDDSTANASATGSYDGANQALSHDQVIIAGGTERVTNAVDVSPVLSIAVTAANAIQADFDAVSDGIVVFRTLTAFYADTSEYDTSLSGHTAAGTIILNLTASGTLVKIELLTGRSNGSSTSGFTFTTKTLEVRVV